MNLSEFLFTLLSNSESPHPKTEIAPAAYGTCTTFWNACLLEELQVDLNMLSSQSDKGFLSNWNSIRKTIIPERKWRTNGPILFGA